MDKLIIAWVHKNCKFAEGNPFAFDPTLPDQKPAAPARPSPVQPKQPAPVQQFNPKESWPQLEERLPFVNKALEEVAPKVWFHGDPIKRTSFQGQKMDRDRQSERGGNLDGPGIYWTSEYRQAESYGKVIHHATMKVSKGRLLTDKTKATPQNVANLISLCDKTQRDAALQNWAETSKEALPLAIKAYVDKSTFADASIAIYHDIFGYEADHWAKAMVDAGYDAYQPSQSTHFVVYNPAVIQLVKEDINEAGTTDAPRW